MYRPRNAERITNVTDFESQFLLNERLVSNDPRVSRSIRWQDNRLGDFQAFEFGTFVLPFAILSFLRRLPTLLGRRGYGIVQHAGCRLWSHRNARSQTLSRKPKDHRTSHTINQISANHAIESEADYKDLTYTEIKHYVMQSQSRPTPWIGIGMIFARVSWLATDPKTIELILQTQPTL